MAKHIIFLVHGMGRYGTYDASGVYKPDQKGWFDDAEAGLGAVYDRFMKDGLPGKPAFKDLFTVVRVEYDSVLDHFRHAWEVQAKDWSKLGVSTGFISSIRKFFEGNNDQAFLWTHLADVALYMAPTVRAQVQVHVATQIVEALATAAKAAELGAWSVIAHSLGTAVIHDTVGQLENLSQAPWAADLGPIPSPRLLCMAANVARLLTETPSSVYDDTLAPIGPGHPTWYMSCAHQLDPFTRVEPFNPTGRSWAGGGYLGLSGLDDYYLTAAVIEWLKAGESLDKFAAIVPHGFLHYMRQPPVAARLWPLLLSLDPSDYPNLQAQIEAAYAGDSRNDLKTGLGQQLTAALGALHLGDPVLEKLLAVLTSVIKDPS